MRTFLVLSLLVVGVAGHACLAMAQSSGTFTATANMTTARFGHTATLLGDGRVLIAGGYTDGYDPLPHAITDTAELYNPATGLFRATGNMTLARAYHTATLLADGRVLIAAGRGVGRSEDNLASAELYDPSTGTFTATGNMTAPSVNDTNTATLLPDGRVLITGTPFRAELYDPGAGTFTLTGNMTVPPPFSTATLLPDGRVLLAAFSPKLYDPRTGTFSLTGTEFGVTGRATLLTNGKVLVAGGNNDPGPIAGAEVYDPSTGVFTATTNMTAPRANFTVTLLPDGKALIAGGSSWIGDPNSALFLSCCLPSAELYDTLTGLFANTGSMAAGRAGHTATLISSGEVLVAGGSGGNTAELYHPGAPVPAPVLFSVSGDGRGPGAILHAGTHQIVSSSNPAVAGEALEIYGAGLMEGSVIPPQVAIGGRMAELLFFGKAPGFVGLNQVNVRVPNGVVPGTAVPVRLTYLSRPSNEVTIGLR